jgi:hypothetical protein
LQTSPSIWITNEGSDILDKPDLIAFAQKNADSNLGDIDKRDDGVAQRGVGTGVITIIIF